MKAVDVERIDERVLEMTITSGKYHQVKRMIAAAGNRVEGLEWKRSPAGRRAAFAKVLDEAGVSYTLRREKGSGIEAACGQLALKRKLEDAGAAGGCANKNVG